MGTGKGENDVFEFSPSIILNTGNLVSAFLTAPNQYGKYSVSYQVGEHNKSFEELLKIHAALANRYAYTTDKRPWKYKKDMVTIFADSKQPVPILNSQGARIHARDVKIGNAVKINVKLMYYSMENEIQYRTPEGTMERQLTHKEGIKLMLNGVQLHQPEPVTEEMF